MAMKQYRVTLEGSLFVTKAAIEGPQGVGVVRLLVDTGSKFTLVAWDILQTVGYDPSAHQERREFLSTTGTAFAPIVLLARLSCLGRTLNRFPILSYTLPFGRYVNGILGMDFLHRFPFKIDTQRGVIESYDPRMPRRARAS